MSERLLSPEILDLINRGVVHPAIFVYADFPSGAKRVWTGIGDQYLMSEDSSAAGTYQGIGSAISFETVVETTDTAAKGISIMVSGLDSDFAAKLVAERYQGRPAVLFLGFWNPDTGLLVEMPEPLWRGKMDYDDFNDSKSKADLKIICSHRLSDILRKREFRYTDRDQQLLYPGQGDTGLSHMNAIQDTTITWGRAQK